jgi:hypothetical protein
MYCSAGIAAHGFQDVLTIMAAEQYRFPWRQYQYRLSSTN